MTETSWYSQGAFCWTECATSDLDQATAFYTKVFGWGAQRLPYEGGVYTMFTKEGKNVAGAYLLGEQEQGTRPHWNVYIAAEDADLVAKEAEQLGGTIVMPASDVSESGRMAWIDDPTGARFGLWQPKDHIGAQLYGDDWTFTWYELSTPDPQRAAGFYSELFGYGAETQEMANGPYTVLTHEGEQAAGIMTAQNEMPAAWTPYVSVPDADATAEAARAAGAALILPPTQIEGIGRFGWITDPQGAVLAFIQPDPRQA